MALRHVDSSPKVDDFTPLHEHQEQTPNTFFGGKPVLYARQAGLTLSAPAERFQHDAVFSKFNLTSDDQAGDALVQDVEIWVNSEDLILFQSSPTPTGVSVPYPSIALHATMKWKSQVDALYMNISLNDPDSVNAEDDIQVLELTVLPPNYASTPEAACIKVIFDAMNTCADLHPDSNESGDEEEGEDETAPGATGWITADNMDEYIDENGNFRGTVIGGEGDQLGPGAGTVRPREDGGDGANGANGVDGEGHENKYYRTN